MLTVCFQPLSSQVVETYKETGKGLNYRSCSKQLPALKQDYEWLKEVDSMAVQSSVRNYLMPSLDSLRNKTMHPALSQKGTQPNHIQQSIQAETLH